jgi:hypothetical protein
VQAARQEHEAAQADDAVEADARQRLVIGAEVVVEARLRGGLTSPA